MSCNASLCNFSLHTYIYSKRDIAHFVSGLSFWRLNIFLLSLEVSMLSVVTSGLGAKITTYFQAIPVSSAVGGQLVF